MRLVTDCTVCGKEVICCEVEDIQVWEELTFGINPVEFGYRVKTEEVDRNFLYPNTFVCGSCDNILNEAREKTIKQIKENG